MRNINDVGMGEGGMSPQGFCCFHPREVVVGVCAACLTEKLLVVLASKQGRHGGGGGGGAATQLLQQVKKDHESTTTTSTRAFMTRAPSRRNKPPSIAMPKVFALGSSLLHRLDSRHRPRPPGYASDHDLDQASDDVLSLDDSFISIKFEDNGRFSWDNKATHSGAAKTPGAHPPGQISQPGPAAAAARCSMVEHARTRGGGGGGGIRWRKRIGHLFQLVRWRRSGKGGAAGVSQVAGFSGKVEGGERRGWMRSLTRRTTE